jgi:hypothetical protein
MSSAVYISPALTAWSSVAYTVGEGTGRAAASEDAGRVSDAVSGVSALVGMASNKNRQKTVRQAVNVEQRQILITVSFKK